MKKNNYIENLITKVFTQAENGKIKIGNASFGEWTFYVEFHNSQTKKDNYGEPIVCLGDKVLLVQLVEKYLKVARDFYNLDKDYFQLNDESFDEKLVMDLFVNATNFDLNNIEKYIEQRTNMLKDKSSECGEFLLGNYLGNSIVVRIAKNKSNLESPYRFSLFLEKDGESFFLPNVHFGKINNKLYVYAMQGEKEKQINKLSKQMDRHFRKANKGVDIDDEILSQVSPNALVSLAIFIAYQRAKGAQTMSAYNFMPIRYNSNRVAGTKRLMTKHEKLEFLEKHDRNQFNISNRFFNTVIRYAHHFNLTVEYDEVYEKLNLNLTSTECECDNIIHTIDSVVCDSLSEQNCLKM